MRIEPPNYKVLGNVSVIVLGVIVASYGEIAFVFIGFVFQACMIVFESIRLVMVQKLLSSPEYKMDPLVSLYYFAPVYLFWSELLLILGVLCYEYDLLHHFRGTEIECSSCYGRWTCDAIYECCRCVLS
jgi:hypothetical protein